MSARQQVVVVQHAAEIDLSPVGPDTVCGEGHWKRAEEAALGGGEAVRCERHRRLRG